MSITAYYGNDIFKQVVYHESILGLENLNLGQAIALVITILIFVHCLQLAYLTALTHWQLREGQYLRPELKQFCWYFASYWGLMVLWLYAAYVGQKPVMQINSSQDLTFFCVHTWLFGFISILQCLHVMICHTSKKTFRPMNSAMAFAFVCLLTVCALPERITDVQMCIALLSAIMLVMLCTWTMSVTSEMLAILDINLFTIKPKSQK